MDRSTLLGMTIGSAVMFGFGIVWLRIGLFRGRRSPRWLRLLLLFAGIVLGALILTVGVRTLRVPPNASPVSARQAVMNREIERHFYLIVGVELAAIFVAVVVLQAIRYPDFILCGIAFIVGAHFFPLAALFRAPFYYGTGLGGCAIGLVGFFMGDERLRQSVVGISFGLLLWTTAGWISWVGLLAARQVVNQLSV